MALLIAGITLWLATHLLPAAAPGARDNLVQGLIFTDDPGSAADDRFRVEVGYSDRSLHAANGTGLSPVSVGSVGPDCFFCLTNRWPHQAANPSPANDRCAALERRAPDRQW